MKFKNHRQLSISRSLEAHDRPDLFIFIHIHCMGTELLGHFWVVQYVAPGPDEKDANVYFLPQKNSSELKFVLQFAVTFP